MLRWPTLAMRRGMITARPLACRALSTLPSLPDMSLTEVADHVVLATLDRPTRGNAFSLAMAESLLELPKALPESTRVLIFTGSGSKAFCTGRDLAESSNALPSSIITPFSAFPAHAYHFNSARLLYTETHTAEQADRYINALIDGILGVRKLPMATIAAINGSSFGAGVELSLACDIRVAAAEATLCFPETSLGIFPGAAGAVLCPRIIGVARAKELIFTARRFSGVEAKEWGVVQHCTSPGGDAYADALELGIKIASNGPLGVRGAKLVMDAMDDSLTFDEQLKLSNDHRFPLNDTEDFKEALKAFSEKRKPVFKGK
jgi:enoyl-CoA hydratase/carnithine racemase